MTYRLYRLELPGDDLDAAMLLGSYEEFEVALAARDTDTAWLFGATAPGELLHAHHQILGPGTHGLATAHPVSSELQRPNPAARRDVTDAHEWLTAIHRSA
jgi:hypothetical protein